MAERHSQGFFDALAKSNVSGDTIETRIYRTAMLDAEKEIDRLKAKLEIATKTLNIIAFYSSSNDELIVGYATEAIVKMSELDKE